MPVKHSLDFEDARVFSDYHLSNSGRRERSTILNIEIISYLRLLHRPVVVNARNMSNLLANDSHQAGPKRHETRDQI
jgi:hypothetical protein